MKKFLSWAIIASLLFCSCSIKFMNSKSKWYQQLPYIQQINQPQKVEEAYQFLKEKTEYDAFIAIKNDSILAEWGEIDTPIMTHSARKSIISVLYGIAIKKGMVRLNQTLEELGIDDNKAPLTALEKTCTIRDLLMSRSGIYIEASGETKEMKEARPQRGMHKPGEFYYYNNWGFNVLGTILEKQAKMSIGLMIEQWLAKPLGMKKFRENHVTYKQPNYSEHRQYIVFMTASDFVKIGLLMLHNGEWQEKQLFSADWVLESTTPYSTVKDNAPMDSYGYLWFIDRDNQTVWASGWGGQFMIIDRKNHLVIVSRNDTGRSLIQQGLFMWKGKQGYRDHHQKLYRLMLEAD
jgi:CubicO group peptidase (beta-lactamase class C family)